MPASARAPVAAAPNGAYLVNLAEEHASARGYQFDEPGRNEFKVLADTAVETAHDAAVFTVEDFAMEVAPNTIRLTDSVIEFAEGVTLTIRSVGQGLAKMCPLFPFC